MSPARNSSERISGVVKIGAVVLVVCLGLWGCARKPANQPSNKALEVKIQKLEQELRTVTSARDKARKELATAEAATARLQQEVAVNQQKITQLEKFKVERNEFQKQLVACTGERDDLRLQMNLRMQERENLNTRLDRMRKGLQQLMSQDDTPGSLLPGVPGITPAAGQVAPTSGPSLNQQS